MSAQLALDALPEWRTRDGIWPIETHQRGWFRLPYDFAAHPLPGHPAPRTGDLLPAWVCCRCGGVEVNSHLLGNNHGCCSCYLGRSGTCISQSLRASHRAYDLARGITTRERPAPFDDAWLPERPR